MKKICKNCKWSRGVNCLEPEFMKTQIPNCSSMIREKFIPIDYDLILEVYNIGLPNQTRCS